MIKNNQINQKAYDLIAQQYNKEHADLEWRRELETFIDLVRDNPGLVLDFGCGPGDETIFLGRKLPKHRVIGVDLSKAMVELGEKKAQDNIKFIRSDFLEFAPSEKVVGVWARASFHHLSIEQLRQMFDRLIDYVQQGGLVMMINKYGDYEEIEEKKKYGQKLVRYFQYFNKELVNKLIRDDFEIIEQRRADDKDHQWLVTLLRRNSCGE